MKELIISQFIILLLGTVFAWGNFIYEFYGWLKIGSCQTGCAVGATNPFLTPCFYGALFFTIAFVLSVVILKKFGI
jgi:hypothetical protein